MYEDDNNESELILAFDLYAVSGMLIGILQIG